MIPDESREGQLQTAALGILIYEDVEPPTLDELNRHLRDTQIDEVRQAVEQLTADGLVRVEDGRLHPTRAAVRAAELQ